MLSYVPSIQNADFSFVREKTSLYREPESTDRFRHAEREFKKFLTLVKSGQKPLAIPSSAVDDIWHAFILYTPQYRQFCEKTFGFFVDHQPNSVETPVPTAAVSNFYTEYEKHFGTPDPIWFEDFDEGTASMLRDKAVPEWFSTQYKWSGWSGRPN
uniref:Uncharacterized protein n=1 Tax=Candidatus Kentrum sp. MB TaxID=2138164 RepID=A0A450XII2_9GAMM|nr:MAG: hypothetical protein BECKMB1821G_GA0114241_10444 [Candidatus Kentron sp. MB]VFK35596.1 MAG: hypothetical protein BECKMB1821I_GA0114274_11308 [Candidatus Kentron sp. MB]VFK77372.1 MAG: hypothetical protein BECKMB1821H_GA0114242_11298 [Candidatus Kentron sp. MB]